MRTFFKFAGSFALFGTLVLTGCGSTSGNSASPASSPTSSTSSSSLGTQSTSNDEGYTDGFTDLPFPPKNPTSKTLLATSMPGYTLYQTTCSGCHGNDLEGGMFGPELRGIGNIATSTQLHKFIASTKYSMGMPPDGDLHSPAQIQQVSDWLAKQTQK